MHAAVHHLARRGVELTAYLHENNDTIGEEYKINLPTWGIVMLASTALIFLVASSAIDYTFGRLIPTLLMVESPRDLYEPLHFYDPDTPQKDMDPELVLVKQKPLTSSFRSTIKHLQFKAGFRARFRGVVPFVVYSFLLSVVSNFLRALPIVPLAAPVFATVLLANLSLAWTHIVISDPSPKPWYRRFPEVRVWRKIAGPTAVLAIAEQLTVIIPGVVAIQCGLGDIDPKSAADMSGAEKQIMALKVFGILALCAVLGLILVVPAIVSLTRVQASLLADDQEAIVPFDRSFGGKVIPEIVGGSGVIGPLDAWKTFDWNSRVRLIKAYLKVFAMQMALSILFIGVAIAQIVFVVGKADIHKIITGPEDKNDVFAMTS